jgi:hypothetical protein
MSAMLGHNDLLAWFWTCWTSRHSWWVTSWFIHIRCCPLTEKHSWFSEIRGVFSRTPDILRIWSAKFWLFFNQHPFVITTSVNILLLKSVLEKVIIHRHTQYENNPVLTLQYCWQILLPKSKGSKEIVPIYQNLPKPINMTSHWKAPKEDYMYLMVPLVLRLSEPNDMTIHWKALKEHFLMVPLLWWFNELGRKQVVLEIFLKNACQRLIKG